MTSMPVQSSVKGTLTRPSFPTPHKPCTIQFKTILPLKHKAHCSLHSSAIVDLKCRPHRRVHKLQASAAIEEAAVSDEISSDSATSQEASQLSQQTLKPAVEGGKQLKKPKLVLKFIWMEKNIGLGLDQEVPGHGTVPLSPYFFWPRKDAWEELKTTLESKPWISQKKMIILLNQATDIINLWQQSGGNLS